MAKADVVIIGAGAVGCAIARELSKYHTDVMVVDMRDEMPQSQPVRSSIPATMRHRELWNLSW